MSTTTPPGYTFSEYQSKASETALYPGQGGFIGLAYAVLGLNGEAGETGEQVKKIWRDDAADIEAATLAAVDRFQRDLPRHLGFIPNPLVYDSVEGLKLQIKVAFSPPLTPERVEKIRKELGDTLWYAAQVATEIGVDLGDIARENTEKLAARRAANLIHGEGSNR